MLTITQMMQISYHWSKISNMFKENPSFVTQGRRRYLKDNTHGHKNSDNICKFIYSTFCISNPE